MVLCLHPSHPKLLSESGSDIWPQTKQPWNCLDSLNQDKDSCQLDVGTGNGVLYCTPKVQETTLLSHIQYEQVRETG